MVIAPVGDVCSIKSSQLNPIVPKKEACFVQDHDLGHIFVELRGIVLRVIVLREGEVPCLDVR